MQPRSRRLPLTRRARPLQRRTPLAGRSAPARKTRSEAQRSTGTPRGRRVASVLRHHGYQIVRDVLIALLAVGVTFTLDNRIATRQEQAEERRAQVQEETEERRAEQQEVLENLRFVRD